MVKDETDDSEVTATIGDWLLSIGYPQSDRPRASLRDRVSKTQSAWGNTKAACQFSGVVADKQCTCPASKLMRERYPPTPPAFARKQRRATAGGPTNRVTSEGCLP